MYVLNFFSKPNDGRLCPKVYDRANLLELQDGLVLSNKELAVGQLIKSNVLFSSDRPKDHFGSLDVYART